MPSRTRNRTLRPPPPGGLPPVPTVHQLTAAQAEAQAQAAAVAEAIAAAEAAHAAAQQATDNDNDAIVAAAAEAAGIGVVEGGDAQSASPPPQQQQKPKKKQPPPPRRSTRRTKVEEPGEGDVQADDNGESKHKGGGGRKKRGRDADGGGGGGTVEPKKVKEEEEEEGEETTTTAIEKTAAAAASGDDAADATAAAEERPKKTPRLTWDERFAELQGYKEHFGDCLVPIRWAENPTLGKWVNNQRVQYKNFMAAKMANEEGEDGANVKMEESDAATKEEEGAVEETAAEATKEESGGAQEKPSKTKKKTASAKKPNRKKKTGGGGDGFRTKNCAMNEERIRRLESIGFAWTTNRERRYDDRWDDRYEQLQAYKVQHGDCNVPHKWGPDPSLAEWVHRQRVTYATWVSGRKRKRRQGNKKKKGEEEAAFDKVTTAIEEAVAHADGAIDAVQGGMVEEEGMGAGEAATATSDDAEAILQAVADADDSAVETNISPDGGDAGGDTRETPGVESVAAAPSTAAEARTAVAAEETKKSDGGHGDSEPVIRKRMAMLEKIGFTFRAKMDVWQTRFEELCRYQSLTGDTLVPINYGPNPALGRWVHTQRRQHRLLRESRNDGKKSSRACITQERINQLESIGFTWEQRVRSGPKLSWEERYQELVAYKEAQGHTRVNAAENAILSRWCKDQRSRLKALQDTGTDNSGFMTPDRVQLLEDIGFDTRGV